jgi:translation initiation factor IF-3
MPTFEALALAKQKMLDLVEVAPNVVPPVCKIMDYGKFQYQQSKQKRIAQAKQKKIEIKGIRMRVQTEEHDRQFKQAQIEKFLKKGDKVKIEIVLKGREKAHADLARTNLQEFLKTITTPYKMEEEIKRYPGGFNVLIAPK